MIYGLNRIADKATARTIRAMVNGDLDPRKVSDRCDDWARRCYNPPSHDDMVMVAADELLNTHGVEGWADEDGSDGLSYLNTGDGYDLTLVLKDGEFSVDSWADMVERNDVAS